jgi:hypothetical protein
MDSSGDQMATVPAIWLLVTTLIFMLCGMITASAGCAPRPSQSGTRVYGRACAVCPEDALMSSMKSQSCRHAADESPCQTIPFSVLTGEIVIALFAMAYAVSWLDPCGFPDRRSRETGAGIRPRMDDQLLVNVRDWSIGWKMLVLI